MIKLLAILMVLAAMPFSALADEVPTNVVAVRCTHDTTKSVYVNANDPTQIAAPANALKAI